MVSDNDRATFLKTGKVTTSRSVERPYLTSDQGVLWIPPLHQLWEYLRRSPRLGDFFVVHRGIEWQSGQSGAWAAERRAGFLRGLHTAKHTRQYVTPPFVWLDCRRNRLRGNAIDLPWAAPKLVANSARLSRGLWRIGATLDTTGLICSQQYFGLWPKELTGKLFLQAFSALLNGPLANAFLAFHSPEKGMRISAVKQIPVPAAFPESLSQLVDEYMQHLHHDTFKEQREQRLNGLLLEIDAALLAAYDLPPRLEHELLSRFPSDRRPVAHDWLHWNAPDAIPGLTLAERVSARYERKASVGEIFAPLPPKEASLLRTYST